MTKPEPICADCQHTPAEGGIYMCARVRCAIAGTPVSCYSERSDSAVMMTPRIPVGEVRCGPHGIHFTPRVAND